MKLLSKFLPFVALLLSGMLQAQTPFWTETFSAGIPAGWANVDASGQGFIWKWCPAPVSTCAPIYIAPFNAPTASTGYVHLDSDAGLQDPLPQNHVSRLTTTAINCSGKNEVWVQFQSHIGFYYGPTNTRAILRVSTNLTNWTNFTPFPDLTTTNQDVFSANPYVSVLNISSVAANQATVYLQWQWTANFEYIWNLDDIRLFDAEPVIRHDIAIGDFFYSPSSLAQPVSQIATDTLAFGANLSNLGLNSQTNVVLRAAVTTNANVELWADSILIPTLAIGVLDSFFELPGRYAPELPIGVYRIRYTVRADSLDQRTGDNLAQSPFQVTDNIFSKEAQPQNGIRSGNLDNINSWYVGNLYQMSAGSLDNYQATRAIFTFDTDDTEILLKDVEADIYLFRVKDGVDFAVAGGFDRSTFFSPDLSWVGVSTYSAPDTMVAGLLQFADLLDFDQQTVGVKLDKGARYLVVVGYSGQSKFTYHAFNQDVKMFFASTFTFSDVWYTNGFGVEDNAVLRMVISLVTTTDDKPLAESSMRIVPNPVRDAVNLAVNFDKPTNATITIADMSGRVIVVQDREGLTQENLSYPVLQLAPGTYLARIATAEGTLTKKFVKL